MSVINMKSIIIFACLVACTLATVEELQATCPQLKCAAKNGSCGFNSGSTVQSLCLPSSQYCLSGTCTDFLKLNETCTPGGPSNQCGALTCTRLAGRNACFPVVYRYDPGEDCTSDKTCYFVDSVTGTDNSTCIKGKCYGKQQGESCEVDGGQCVTGLFCDATTTTCVALKPTGQACASRFECETGSCIPQAVASAAKECRPFQSVDEGGACETTEDCVDGFYCSAAASGSLWGACTAVHTSSYKVCTKDSDCNAPESCTCNSVTGTLTCVAPPARSKALAAAEMASFNCTIKYNCADTKCTVDNCAAEVCAYNKLMFGDAVWNDNILGLQCIYGEVVVGAYAHCHAKVVETADAVTNDAHQAAVALPVAVFVVLGIVAVLAF